MSFQVEKAILKTLAYSDIFDYPLTKEELWSYLISSETISSFAFEQTLKRSKPLKNAGGFYFLFGRNSIVKKRIERERESKRKLKIAKRISMILSNIPTIQFIGITGALAMNNSDENDDIDLFLITSAGGLWISRLLVLIILEFFGIRRKRKKNNVSDTICVNMLITQKAFSLPYIKKDLYTAHEIIQMKQLFDRSKNYENFMIANQWIKKYLPNNMLQKVKRKKTIESVFNSLIVKLLELFEFPAKLIQLISIQRHMTTEIISDHVLAFHPFDYRKKILTEYIRRSKMV